MNHMYQFHHTIANTTNAISPTPARSSEDSPRHQRRIRSGGTSGAVYQRRAQFRVAIASYQGKPTRPIPSGVIEEIRQQVEDVVAHLIDTSVGVDNPLQRYALITRVHILSILRSTGSGKYSRWYRDSHYLHHMITRQPAPDIADCENILVIMFGIGKFFLSTWISLLISVIKEKQGVHA